jgi:lipopolysaccharide export system protein LptA
MKMLRKSVYFCAAAAFLFGAAAFGAGGASTNTQLNDLRGLQLKNAKIPVLNQGKLQMVIFSSSAERRGEMMVGFNTVLAIIRRGADSDAIRDDWDIATYALGAPLADVLKFWKDRIGYCEGFMDTPEAEIDSTGTGRASGSREVHFRSPFLDLDGTGFDVDFERRTISVNSQVQIVIRYDSADPAKLLKDPTKMPEKYEPVRASGDSMLIDTKRNEVMLIGHVRVEETKALLTCDRLTIFWGAESKENLPEKRPEGMDLHNSGIDRILADGNVVITKRDSPGEQILADHLICDVPKGTAILSGDDEFPRLVSANGEVLSGRDIHFERHTKRGHITGGCRIDGAPETNDKGEKVVRKGLVADSGFFDADNNFADFAGNVKMRDGDRTVTCDRLRILTDDSGNKKEKKAAAPEKNQSESFLGSPDMGTGGKALKSADFQGRVVLKDAAGYQLSCNRMHTDFVPGGNAISSADCFGKVEMVDSSNSKLNCEEMHAEFAATPGGGTDLTSAKWFRKVRVESAGSADAPPGVITADRGELDNRNARVTFEKNVKGLRDKATLNCERLDIYLAEKSGSSTAAPGSIAVGAGNGRIIRKTVASRKVRITDESGSLDCDRLSLFFTELPPGAKPEPGMFQSGGARLTDILAEGNIVAVNKSSVDSQKQPGLIAGKSSGARVLKADRGQVDLTRHLSHFRGAVNIKDDENSLSCDDIYLYGVRRMAALKANAEQLQSDDPDADPFALPGFNEDTVPAAVNLTDDVQLKKVLCLGNVKIERTDPDTGRKQEAGGGRCVYIPEKRTATMTDTPPKLPWLRAEGRQQHGSRIVYDLNDNVFRSYDTDTFTIDDKPLP